MHTLKTSWLKNPGQIENNAYQVKLKKRVPRFAGQTKIQDGGALNWKQNF